jgi:hypothetical protein
MCRRAVAVLVLAASYSAPAQDDAPTPPGHPYARISSRNAFGVKPPPPPPAPEPVVEPPKEKPDFFLSGFTSIDGEKRAFIAMQPKGKPLEYREPLIQGVEDDGLKLVDIDEEAEAVRIEYNGEEISLTLADNAPKATAVPAVQAAPGTPGGATGTFPGISPNGPRPTQVPGLTGANFNGSTVGGTPTSMNSGPTIIGRGGAMLGNFLPVSPGQPGVGISPNNPGSAGNGFEVPAVQPTQGDFGSTLPANPNRGNRAPPPPAPFPAIR